MDLSFTQHSPSIFSSNAIIGPRKKKVENATTGQGSRCVNQHSNSADWPIIPAVLVLLDFLILISFYSNFYSIEGPYTIRFFKIDNDR